MKSIIVPFIILLFFSCYPKTKQETEWAAKIDREYIGLAELDAQIQPEMYESLFNTYYARKTMADELIAAKLLSKRAKKLGISKDSLTSFILLQASDSIRRKKFIEENFLQNGLVDPERIGRKIPLNSEKGQQILSAKLEKSVMEKYLNELKAESKIEIWLKPPLSPSLDLSEINYHSLLSGSKQKSVFWLFSDYNCSHCLEFYPTLEKLMAQYGGQIDFRYTSLTDNISEMILLGEFAGQNGKMDTVNSLIFSETKLGPPDPKRIALAAGLDYEKFRHFASDPTRMKLIKENNLKLKNMQKFQVTPTIIINNRVYYGDISFKELDIYIKEYCL